MQTHPFNSHGIKNLTALKRKISIWTIAILTAGTTIYINRATVIQKFQLFQLKSIKCPASRQYCHDLFWVHRVNSIKKYKELEKDFSGFEIDITYIDSLRSFFVFHPPAENLEKIPTWEEFSNSIDWKAKKIYLDMRGVDSHNVFSAIKTLENTAPAAILKKQTVIELYDYHAANIFYQMGYNVTLSYFALNEISTNETRTDIFIETLNNIRQLSGDVTMLAEMKKRFPGKKYIIWDLSYKNYTNTQRFLNNIADSNIVLIMASISSKYSR
ncbi:MAG: hypothetical protein KF746_28075 [Chitinophagaceae bacterium]|nr:hypothetical protein [Chitinophagaceae bacterium]